MKKNLTKKERELREDILLWKFLSKLQNKINKFEGITYNGLNEISAYIKKYYRRK